MQKKSSKISKKSGDTEKIAAAFLKTLKKTPHRKAAVVALSGDLGAGKTAFTKVMAKLLGVKRTVSSPTFVLMRRYALKSKKFSQLFHLDAYRLKNHTELEKLGWKDIIANPEHIVFIEWPENVAKALPKKHHHISISHTREGHRSFKIR